jgi:DNA-binding protein Fis
VFEIQKLKAELEHRIGGGSREGAENIGVSEVNPFVSMEILPALRRVTHLLIDEAMSRSGGNQTLAAHLLGLSRTTLNQKLKKIQ